MIKVNSTLLARTLSLVSQSAKTLMDIVQDSRTKFGGIIQVTKSKIVLTAAFFFNAFYRDVPDTVGITDSKTATLTKALENSYQVQDDHFANFSKNRFDVFNVSDTTSLQVDFYRSFFDTAQIEDASFANLAKPLANSFSIGDSFGTVNQFYRSFDSVASFTDDVNGAALDDDQNVTYWKVLTNSFNVVDSVSQSNQYYRVFEDDYIAGDLQYSLYGKNLTNEFNLEDTHSIINVFYRDFNSSVSFTDDINGAALDDDQNVTYWKVLTNNFNVVDTVSNYSTKPLYHNINLIESFSAEPAKNLQNSFAVTDSLVASIGFLPTLFDNFSLSDVRYNLVGKALSSGAGFGESINTFGLTKALTSSLNITDDINGAAVDDDQNVVYFKNTSNLFTVNEINIKLLVKGLADSIGITSTGIILTQSFASDPMYFGEDFIGSQTNI